MSIAETSAALTPEDLLAMPNEKGYELVDGHLEERTVSALSSWIAGLIYYEIMAFLASSKLGVAWPADNGFQCFPDDPSKVRRHSEDVTQVHLVPKLAERASHAGGCHEHPLDLERRANRRIGTPRLLRSG